MSPAIGLFGGTFDPVHNGHLSIARSFLESPLISELWILLTPVPPHKHGNGHVKYETRYKMLSTAFEGLSGIRILTIENELPKPSYTYNTIRHLKELHPDKEFMFCMGEDSLTQFHTWKYYHEILEEAKLLVAERPGSDHSVVDKKILDHTIFVEHEPLEISSSQIKEFLKKGESLSDLLPQQVINIIEKEHLYR